MKRFLILTLVALLSVPALYAQNKVGYVNTETILASVPEYKVAAEKLEALNNQYKANVQSAYAEIEKMYNSYQGSKMSMSQAMRQAKENEIIAKEKKAKELQQNYFGQGGIMEKKSEELLGPLKERIQKAIDKIAAEGHFMIIFDTAVAKGAVYTDKSADLSSRVIAAL